MTVDCLLQNKTATRLPEALWLRFTPAKRVANASTWNFNKLGSWISPSEVLLNGSHALHAVQDEGVRVKSFNGVHPAANPQHQRRHLSAGPRRHDGNSIRGSFEDVTDIHQAEQLQISSADAALVCAGYPNPFPNLHSTPDMGEGVAFNLANNIWGTNYIMWVPYTEKDRNLAFRFDVQASPAPASAATINSSTVTHCAAVDCLCC